MTMSMDDGNFDCKQKISNNVYYVSPLHYHPELIDDCCVLINKEWKRSHVARLRSLSTSTNNFPTSLILLQESNKPKVIGHCKLSRISQFPLVFIETVVIHPDYRGKGLGRFLLEKTELYLRSKKIEWVYLTTAGQKLFYEKLGYSVCNPINIYGHQVNHIFQNVDYESNISPVTATKDSNQTSSYCVSDCSDNISNQVFLYSVNSPPPPPPPPCPPISELSLRFSKVVTESKKNYMRKKIS